MNKYALACCLLFVVCACNRPHDKQQTFFYQGTDSYNRTISLKHEPQRVVSLSETTTEIAFLLNCGDKLVGISDFCTYPPETKEIPKVGKLININIESILNAHPDLILFSSIISRDDVYKLDKTGIPAFALKKENRLEDLFSTISTMGDIFNCRQAADSLIRHYRKEINTLKYDTIPHAPSIYYVVGYGATGDFTAPGNSYIHDILSLAGAENIGEPLTQWNISREILFEQDPDIILIRKEDLESFCHTKPYDMLRAVRTQQIYPIQSDWIDIIGPRNIEAIKYIHEIINHTAGNESIE